VEGLREPLCGTVGQYVSCAAVLESEPSTVSSKSEREDASVVSSRQTCVVAAYPLRGVASAGSASRSTPGPRAIDATAAAASTAASTKRPTTRPIRSWTTRGDPRPTARRGRRLTPTRGLEGHSNQFGRPRGLA
jgi:hypothetical protein